MSFRPEVLLLKTQNSAPISNSSNLAVLGSFKAGQPLIYSKNEIWIFQYFSFGGGYQTPKLHKMKFEGDLNSIIVTRDFFVTATIPLFLPSLGKEMALAWMAVMMWVAEAEGWC